MNIKGGLTFRFIIRIVAILVIAQFLILLWSSLSQRKRLNEDLLQLVMLSGKIIEHASSIALTTLDFTNLEQIVDEVLTSNDIVSVQVVDNNGIEILSKTKENMSEHTRSIRIPIKTGEAVIGSVLIGFSTERVRSALMKHVIFNLTFQVIMLYLIIMFIYFYFNKEIGAKIENISSVISRVTTGDLRERVTVEGQSELGIITKGLNFLIDRLSNIVNKLKSISTNVATAIRQLNLTFKNVINGVENQHKAIEGVLTEVKDAAKSQSRIIENTEKLLALSGDNLSALLELKASSEEIAAATENLYKNINESYSSVSELTQSSHNVSEMAEDASSAVHEASASIEEISHSIKEVERVAKESSEISSQTATIVAEKGILSVAEAVEKMEMIEHSTRALKLVIEQLESRSKDIEKVLSVIKEITDQTGLLSLNAQILAVQAGEHGKSFSVVAEEMRELSNKTAKSTKEIAQIVESIKKEIKEAVTETKHTAEVVKKGNKSVVNTANALEEILQASKKSAEIARSIELAATEQAKGLELIVMAIEKIRAMIQDVNKATDEQERGLSFLLERISSIKEAAEITKKATEEQAESASFITENIETANSKTSEIAAASAQQQRVNNKIISSMEEVLKVGKETIRDVKEVSIFISSLQNEVDLLKKEINIFKTDNGKGK